MARGVNRRLSEPLDNHNMASARKIFCIGFHKTGTTSLYAALTALGFRVTGTVLHKWTAQELEARGAAECVKLMKGFDACEDMPWPHFYRALDAAYPGSKFILTVRDPENWYASIDNHFGHQTTELNAFAYGREHARARENREHWIATYKAHNDGIRAYFRDRPEDLLEMSLADGDGWDKLCPFVGADRPDAPFPVKNTSARRHSLAYRVKRKLWLMAGATPHPERLL